MIQTQFKFRVILVMRINRIKPMIFVRENAHKLMLENEALLGAMQQTEEDTIDVITFLKKQDQEKDKQVSLFPRKLWYQILAI